MKTRLTAPLILFLLTAFGSFQAQAVNVAISFTGLTGSLAQNTGVFRADLTGLGLTELASIRIFDASTTEGSPGIWSGFDLDAIKLSTTLCATAACADAAAGILAVIALDAGLRLVARRIALLARSALGPGDELAGRHALFLGVDDADVAGNAALTALAERIAAAAAAGARLLTGATGAEDLRFAAGLADPPRGHVSPPRSCWSSP